MQIIPSFCCFASFSIAFLTLLIINPDSSRDLTVFMISFISLFEIINVARRAMSEGCIPHPKAFLYILANGSRKTNV